MTRLKELKVFSAGLLVGWLAWMVAAPVGINCQSIQASYENTQKLYDERLVNAGQVIKVLQDRLDTAHSTIRDLRAHVQIVTVKKLTYKDMAPIAESIEIHNNLVKQEVDSIKALAAQVKPLEAEVKVSPHETEQTRADGVALWLRDSLNQAKAAWRGAMRVP